MVYNIEKVDQDITMALGPGSALTAEWKGDLVGGVMVIKGAFADGTPMMAIPNFARTSRDPAPPPLPPAPAAPPAGAPPGTRGPRPAPPPTSTVWIKEG